MKDSIEFCFPKGYVQEIKQGPPKERWKASCQGKIKEHGP